MGTKLGLIWWSIVTLANVIALAGNSLFDFDYFLGAVTALLLVFSALMLVVCWTDLEATND